MSDHSWDFVGDWPILVVPCPMIDYYMQHFWEGGDRGMIGRPENLKKCI